MAITAPTPITIPSMVRNERSLFARRESSATWMVSPICIRGFMSAPSAACAAASAPTTASARDPGHAAAHALANAALGLSPVRLRLGDAEKHDLFTLFQTIQHLRVVEVAQAQPHDPGLEPALGLHERDLRATRAPCASASAGASTAAKAAATPAATPAPAETARRVTGALAAHGAPPR